MGFVVYHMRGFEDFKTEIGFKMEYFFLLKEKIKSNILNLVKILMERDTIKREDPRIIFDNLSEKFSSSK